MVTRTRPREHDILAHTADMGLRAAAADLPGLFEEVAVALGEIGADLEPDAGLEQATKLGPGAEEAPVGPDRRTAADESTVPHEPTMADESVLPFITIPADDRIGAGGPIPADGRFGADQRVAVRLRASDLVGLTFQWLNELIGLADAAHSAIATTRVERIERSTAEADWELEAHVLLRPFGGGGARPRLGVKSATLHRLSVEREPGGWSLVAYLDV